MVTASLRLVSVTDNHNALINLTKEKPNAVSRSSHSTTIKDVDVLPNNSSAPMEIVSLRPTTVMENHNALIFLMKVTRDVASTATSSMTTRDVDVIQRLNGLVLMENVSVTINNVMVKSNASMDLMKVTRAVASRNTLSMTTRNVAATQKLNGAVLTETVFLSTVDVMVKPNAPMNLMKVTNNVASTDTHSTIMRYAVAIQRANGPVEMEIVSSRLLVVMVKPNVVINLMKVTRSAASENTISMEPSNVAATQTLNGPVPTVNASLRINFVMVKPNVLMDLMTEMTSVASRTTSTTHPKDVAA
jgi:hypothetical protein